MIIHRLLLHYRKHGDDELFYVMQARDAIRWIMEKGVTVQTGTCALDLGCGHGILGGELAKQGCQVMFADESNELQPDVQGEFRAFNIDRDDLATLGQFDLVVCSNVFEHLAKPEQFLETVHQILTPSGILFLSWTNWLSPWGGHEFSPYHYLGASRGHLLWDRITGRKRKHTPFQNLFPTYIGRTLRMIRRNPNLRLLRMAPRYYTEFAVLARIPILREFAMWNFAALIGRN